MESIIYYYAIRPSYSSVHSPIPPTFHSFEDKGDGYTTSTTFPTKDAMRKDIEETREKGLELVIVSKINQFPEEVRMNVLRAGSLVPLEDKNL